MKGHGARPRRSGTKQPDDAPGSPVRRISDAFREKLDRKGLSLDWRLLRFRADIARDLLRWHFPGADRRGLLYALRLLISDDDIASIAERGEPAGFLDDLVAGIRGRFDLHTPPEPLEDEHLRQAVEAMSAAVARIEERR